MKTEGNKYFSKKHPHPKNHVSGPLKPTQQKFFSQYFSGNGINGAHKIKRYKKSTMRRCPRSVGSLSFKSLPLTHSLEAPITDEIIRRQSPIKVKEKIKGGQSPTF